MKSTSLDGYVILSIACANGSAEGCLESGKGWLADRLDTERFLKDRSKRYEPKGLKTVEVYLRIIAKGCTMKLAAACRELGTFYAKDWPEIGTKKNSKTAAEWYQRSCDLDPVANKGDCERAKRLQQ